MRETTSKRKENQKDKHSNDSHGIITKKGMCQILITAFDKVTIQKQKGQKKKRDKSKTEQQSKTGFALKYREIITHECTLSSQYYEIVAREHEHRKQKVSKSQNCPWACWMPHPCWMPEI